MSAVSQFNCHLKNLISNLRSVFPTDNDLTDFEDYYEFVHVNVRMFINPFQEFVVTDSQYVKNILSSNKQWFILHDFSNDKTIGRDLGKYENKKVRIIIKLKELISSTPEDAMKTIFDNMKVLIYFALLDKFREERQPEKHTDMFLEICMNSENTVTSRDSTSVTNSISR